MNVPSDNFIAETLIKALGARFGGAGTTERGRGRRARERRRARDRAPTVVDGSGLSRSNRTSPKAVVGAADGDGRGRARPPFEASLPVAGRTGHAVGPHARHLGPRPLPRQDRHAVDVSALAGYCDTRGGGRVAFAFLMNYVYPWTAHRAPGPHGRGARPLRRLIPPPAGYG